MESLLCEEDWLTTLPPIHHCTMMSHNLDKFNTTMQDCENALTVCLQKEVTYMPPQHEFINCLQSSHSFHARIRAIQWFIKTRRRLNLSYETVFNAANYLDRFIYMNEGNGRRSLGWVELVSVACLSIAAKYWEVSIPQLHDLQMEDLEHSFQSSTIQRMELTVLKSLEWRLGCITAYSYVELLLKYLDSLQPHLHCTLTSRLTELLLGALSDPNFSEFRPSTIAISALRCGLDELFPSLSNTYLSNVINHIPQNQMDDIESCHKIMEERVADPLHSLSACGYSNFPSSPVTVMPMQQIDTFNCHFDLSLFMESASILKFPSNPRKRKREEDA